MKKEMSLGKRRLTFVVGNGIKLGSLFFWFYYGANWGKNILLFMVWLEFIVLFLNILIPDCRNKIYEKGRSFPSWLSVGLDLIVVFSLVSIGWFVTAIAQLLTILFEQIIFSGELDKRKREKI